MVSAMAPDVVPTRRTTPAVAAARAAWHALPGQFEPWRYTADLASGDVEWPQPERIAGGTFPTARQPALVCVARVLLGPLA